MMTNAKHFFEVRKTKKLVWQSHLKSSMSVELGCENWQIFIPKIEFSTLI